MTSGSRGIVLCALVAAVALPRTVSAQAAPLVVEVRTGAAVPLAGLADGSAPGEGVTAGASFGVDFAVSGRGRRSIYAGFSQHRFDCADAGCASGGRFVATTLDLGFRFSLLTRGPVVPWLRLGGLTMRMETPELPDGPAGLSDRGYGGEVGAGLYVGAWNVVAFNPGVRFTAIGTRLPGGSDLAMRFLVADLGLSLSF